MPAEVLFAGGRLDSLIAIGAPAENTTTSYRDTAYTDVSVQYEATIAEGVRFYLYTSTAGVLSATTVVSGESLWVHCDHASSANYTLTRALFTIFDSAGFPWFRVRLLNTAGSLLEYNSGTGASPVWTAIGTAFAVSGTRANFDLKLALGSPHSAEFYVNGSLIASGSFTQALFTNAARCDIGASANSGANHVSQILATRDISTVGAKVRYSRATGAGANSGWSGAFSDVNEAVGSDAGGNSAGSAGLKQSYAMGDVTVPSGFEIKSVFHWVRAKNDGSAPTNIKSLLRSGGADYSTGNLSGIGLGFSPVGARYDTDPATATNWTQSGWNAVEAGYESAT